MKPKILLGLALVLSGGLFGCSQTEQTADDFAANGPSSTNTGQSFDSLLNEAFPGRNFRDINHVHFQRLPLAQRNKIAVAAASELSLQTTNGLMITAETVDKLFQYRGFTTHRQKPRCVGCIGAMTTEWHSCAIWSA